MAESTSRLCQSANEVAKHFKAIFRDIGNNSTQSCQEQFQNLRCKETFGHDDKLKGQLLNCNDASDTEIFDTEYFKNNCSDGLKNLAKDALPDPTETMKMQAYAYIFLTADASTKWEYLKIWGPEVASKIKSLSKQVQVVQLRTAATAYAFVQSDMDKRATMTTAAAVSATDSLLRAVSGGLKYLHEKEIKYQCFNKTIRTQMLCYGVGSVATTASGLKLEKQFEALAKEVLAAQKGIGKVDELAKKEIPHENRRKPKDIPLHSEKRIFHNSTMSAPAYEELREFRPATVAKMPDNMRLSERVNLEGKKQIYFERPEKLSSGEWVRGWQEIQMDSLTGAIDGNYPSGREFANKLIKAKAGEAHVAFIDVGVLGEINKAAGKKEGNKYIQGVAEKIMKHGQGKVTLIRQGGDEFMLIVDEKDSKKVQQILETIRNDLRADTQGPAKRVFHDEKARRAQAYRENPSPENRERIAEFARVQQPDISIGSAQIGVQDQIPELMAKVEEQAKRMKTETALKFGRSANKYGSTATPNERPEPMFKAEIDVPAASSSFNKQASSSQKVPPLEKLRSMKLTPQEEIYKTDDLSIARYKDELGGRTYRLERRHIDSVTGKEEVVSYDLPERGNTGLLDANHPECKKLIQEHFNSHPNNKVLVPKLANLQEINYLPSGTQAGDKMLEVLAEEVKVETRKSDLSFKFGGKDFIVSMQDVTPEEVKKAEERIARRLANSPEVKRYLDKERERLVQAKVEASSEYFKLKDADAKSKAQLRVQQYDQQIDKLRDFKPQVTFQTVTNQDFPGVETSQRGFNEIVEVFEKKFKEQK